jgi:probable F420-dependent oxidoreductase
LEFGVATVLTDEGIDPLEFARVVEELGFESLLVADHTHIPIRRESAYPHPPFGDLPRQYFRILDPFSVLAAIGSVTSTLKLGTGVCVVVERDPIILAKQVATIDLLTAGRFIFGVGAGWNKEEMRNHGTDPAQRMTILSERIMAIKSIWANEEAEFHGHYVDFDPLYSWPKPVQLPHPPILIGGGGPTVLDRVLAFGDGWMPGHQRDLAALGVRISELRERAKSMGRDPIPITIFGANLARLRDYEALGVSRCLFLVPTHEKKDAISKLKECRALLF